MQFRCRNGWKTPGSARSLKGRDLKAEHQHDPRRSLPCVNSLCRACGNMGLTFQTGDCSQAQGIDSLLAKGAVKWLRIANSDILGLTGAQFYACRKFGGPYTPICYRVNTRIAQFGRFLHGSSHLPLPMPYFWRYRSTYNLKRYERKENKA